MLCRKCKERFNVLREWAATVKCPSCDGTLDAAKDQDDSPKLENPVGYNIGGCRILELIGKGQMGSVYRGVHMGLKRDVAVKMVPITKTNKPMLKRLVFEARTMARVEHPNIVQVYDVGIQQPFLYIVMQLVRGQTLMSQVRELIVDLEATLDFIRQISRGLFAAHSKGVVHRDLKPENIMVVDDTVKIMDFGLAMDSARRDDLSGMIVGTPYYISPEQWLGGKVDARSDLYSLGVIFYFMLTQQKPFEAKTMSELQRLHVSEPPKSPRDINKSVPEEVSFIVLKLLEKDPNRRYASAKELLEDLDRYKKGQEVKAMYNFKKFIKCKFCDTLNVPSATACKICGEGLSAEKLSLDIQLRSGEFNCPGCKNIVERGRPVCPFCRKRFCPKCGVRFAAATGVCAKCS
jgi:serine/threonine protein kinase